MMTSCPDASVLQRFLLGQLPPEELEALGPHVDGCPACRNTLRSLQVHDPLLEALQHPPPSLPVPDTVLEQLLQRLARLDAAPADPQVTSPGSAYQLPFPAPDFTRREVECSSAATATTWPLVPGYELLGV